MNRIGGRALGLVAALGFVIGACTTTVPEAQVPTSVGHRGATSAPPAHSGAPVDGGGAAAAPARARLLNMQDVSAALGDDGDVQVKIAVEVSSTDAALPSMTFTTTTDSSNARFSYRSGPVDLSGGDAGAADAPVPGYEVVGQENADGVDLFVRPDGADEWVHLILDASLVGQTDVFRDPGVVLDSFDLGDVPGLTFTEDGTGVHDGQTMSRQVARFDLGDILGEAFSQRRSSGGDDGTDAMTTMFSELMGSQEARAFLPTGTVELLVDADSTPRRIAVELSMGDPTVGAGAAAMSMRSVMTIDPAPVGGIALPGRGDVSETVTVRSLADLESALGALGPALAWN